MGASLNFRSLPSSIPSWIRRHQLTSATSADPKLLKTLLNYLEHAAAAGDRGQSGQHVPWLDRYLELLQKVRGTELPAAQADPLILIGRALKAGSQ